MWYPSAKRHNVIRGTRPGPLSLADRFDEPVRDGVSGLPGVRVLAADPVHLVDHLDRAVVNRRRVDQIGRTPLGLESRCIEPDASSPAARSRQVAIIAKHQDQAPGERLPVAAAQSHDPPGDVRAEHLRGNLLDHESAVPRRVARPTVQACLVEDCVNAFVRCGVEDLIRAREVLIGEGHRVDRAGRSRTPAHRNRGSGGFGSVCVVLGSTADSVLALRESTNRSDFRTL